MKFSDGYWQVRDGFDVQHPAQAYDVSADDRALTVLAPTRLIAEPRRHAQPADRDDDADLAAARRRQGADRASRRRSGSGPELRPPRCERPDPDHRDHRRASQFHAPAGSPRGSSAATAGSSTSPRDGQSPDLQPRQDHRPGHRPGPAAIRLPAADARRRRNRVRPRGAVRPGRQERSDGGHLERRRRHQQRPGLQERAVLLDEPRLRGLRQSPGAGLLRDRLGGGLPQPILGAR